MTTPVLDAQYRFQFLTDKYRKLYRCVAFAGYRTASAQHLWCI